TASAFQSSSKALSSMTDRSEWNPSREMAAASGSTCPKPLAKNTTCLCATRLRAAREIPLELRPCAARFSPLPTPADIVSRSREAMHLGDSLAKQKSVQPNPYIRMPRHPISGFDLSFHQHASHG